MPSLLILIGLIVLGLVATAGIVGSAVWLILRRDLRDLTIPSGTVRNWVHKQGANIRPGAAPLEPLTQEEHRAQAAYLERFINVRSAAPRAAHLCFPAPPALAQGISAAVPHLVSVGQAIPDGTFRMVLKPELLAGVKDGSLRMMQSVGGGIRGNVVDAAGVIRGQASFEQAQRVLSFTAAASFQLLSFAVGQAHLAAINARLGRLEQGMASILAFLEQTERAELDAVSNWIRDTAAVLPEKYDAHDMAWLERKSAHLDDVWQVLDKIESRVWQEMERRYNALKSVDMTGTFSSAETDRNALGRACDDVAQIAKYYESIMYVRQLAMALAQGLSLDVPLHETHRFALVDNDSHRYRDIMSRALIAMDAKSRQMSGAFSRGGTIDKYRIEATSRLRQIGYSYHSCIMDHNSSMKNITDISKRLGRIRQDGLEVEIKRIAGRPDEVSLLS